MSMCRNCGLNAEKDVPIELDGWYVDVLLNRVEFHGQPCHLTLQQVSALHTIMKAGKHGATRLAIFNRMSDDEDVDIKIVDVVISRARQKMKLLDPDHNYVKTIWGIGYLWEKGTYELQNTGGRGRPKKEPVEATAKTSKRKFELAWEKRAAARRARRRA